jgi:DNA-binding MarR family transcriptional regulator
MCKVSTAMTDNHTPNPGQGFALETFLPYRLSLLSNTVSQGISTVYRKRYGLSVTEWRVVAILGRYPGLTASDVMQRGAMDKVAVSRAVRKLQEKNLLERSAHAQDRRRLPLRLSSSAGAALFAAVVPRALAYEQALLKELSEAELHQLSELLARLQNAAEAINLEAGQKPPGA